MRFSIKGQELLELNNIEPVHFPLYTPQLMNLANQNSQATRPKNVGQLSELFPEYLENADFISVQDWKDWYYDRFPDAIDIATEKVFKQVLRLQDAIQKIDWEIVRVWVEDLVIYKTFNGMYVQIAILSKLADILGTTFRLANTNEEALGIDGYVGENPYSIKPDTYKIMDRLPEMIGVKMIFYKKTKAGIQVEIEE